MRFSVSLLFKCVKADAGDDPELWEERIVLLEADDEFEARSKAKDYAKHSEHSYIAATGQKVIWIFDRIDTLYTLLMQADLSDGSELFSRFLDTSQVACLFNQQKKA